MAMTRDETIKYFMRAIEELRESVDTETFNTAMQGFADHMTGAVVINNKNLPQKMQGMSADYILIDDIAMKEKE
jgi:hypothetical protein